MNKEVRKRLMNELFEKYKKLDIDYASLSLERIDNQEDYFCYPINAIPIGYEGCIMYCFIEGYDDKVFACNPESCVDINVYPLASSFEDFLRLVVTCGSANPLEQIIWMNKKQFDEHLENERQNHQQETIEKLKKEFLLEPIDDPYVYVKNIQKDFDDSLIEYSDDCYDTLGLENDDSLEFVTVFRF